MLKKIRCLVAEIINDLRWPLHLMAIKKGYRSVAIVRIVICRILMHQKEGIIMSLRPEKRDLNEIRFTSELGWLASISIAIVALAPLVFPT